MILLSLLGPLLFFGGLIALVVFLVRRRGGEAAAPADPGLGSVRRVFLYGLAFSALMLATSGVTQLISHLLGSLFGATLLQSDSFRIAFGVSATVVAAPIWLLLWRAAARSIAEHPGETGTLGRKSYLYLVLAVSAVVVGTFLTQLLHGLFAPAFFEVEDLAPLLAWGALWGLHWRWEAAEGQPTETARIVRRLYAYLLSAIGLVLLAIGTGLLLRHFLRVAYDQRFGGSLLSTGGGILWTDTLSGTLAVAIVGGLGWWMHWHRIARGDVDSVPRQIVLFILGIFGGLVTAVSGGAAILHTGLLWLFDRAGATPAATHFDLLPGALATLVVGASIWRYHSVVTLVEAGAVEARIVGVRRLYRYLMAGVGLATLAAGLATLFGTLVGAIIPGARGNLTGTRWWADPLALALTLVAVGAPIWRHYWFAEQRTALSGAPGARSALARRIFLFTVLGIALLATLTGLSTFLVLILEPLFEGRLTAAALDGGKWALGVVLTAGTISLYYWQVLKEDRAVLEPVEDGGAGAASVPSAGPRTSPTGGSVVETSTVEITALAPRDAAALLRAIEARLGTPVRVWWREDGEGSPEATEARVEAVTQELLALASAGAARILLVVDRSGIRAVRFRGE